MWQDADEGYTDALAGQGKKEAPKAPPTGLPAHFSMAGTAEHAIVRPHTAQPCCITHTGPRTGPRLSGVPVFRIGARASDVGRACGNADDNDGACSVLPYM